jgi:hypothetical protein
MHDPSFVDHFNGKAASSAKAISQTHRKKQRQLSTKKAKAR